MTSVITTIDHNRAAVAEVHRAATVYLAAAELPPASVIYTDSLTEDARAELEAALERLLAADPRSADACTAAIRATRDAMHRLDVALGLAPGAPPIWIRWWRVALAHLAARWETRP